MANKTLVYIGLGVILLVLVLSLFGGMHGNTARNTGHMNEQSASSNTVGNMDHMNNQPSSSSNEELAKYRSEEIPEECRLSEYDNDVEKWKEHLSHHQNTWYCLEYYN